VDQDHFLRTSGRRPEGCRYRLRRCLLKGCERWYWPRGARSHYCSDACQLEARRWRRWRASQRYRASPLGQERRRAQSRRYRQRCRERRAVASADAAQSREGQRIEAAPADFSGRPCDRPGCYELFAVAHEHQCKRFCSMACRLALRRVLDRESRMRQRRRRLRRWRLSRRPRPPNTS
jgi:hypothetical protein